MRKELRTHVLFEGQKLVKKLAALRPKKVEEKNPRLFYIHYEIYQYCDAYLLIKLWFLCMLHPTCRKTRKL